jgi:hypothetical protein
MRRGNDAVAKRKVTTKETQGPNGTDGLQWRL